MKQETAAQQVDNGRSSDLLPILLALLLIFSTIGATTHLALGEFPDRLDGDMLAQSQADYGPDPRDAPLFLPLDSRIIEQIASDENQLRATPTGPSPALLATPLPIAQLPDPPTPTPPTPNPPTAAPTATFTPTTVRPTRAATSPPRPTATDLPTATPKTPTPTPTVIAAVFPSPTATFVPPPPSPTAPPQPAANTPTPTPTAEPPAPLPTATTPPTASATPVPLATATTTPSPTPSHVPPLATSTATSTATPSATVAPTNTSTPTPTNTPVATSTPTNTPLPPPTSTPTPSPTVTPLPALPLRPKIECVRADGDGSYTAIFGYLNVNEDPVSVPVGAGNHFSPLPADRGQPTVFQPGRHHAVFSVSFDGSPLNWTLFGHTARANSDSVGCD